MFAQDICRIFAIEKITIKLLQKQIKFKKSHVMKIYGKYTNKITRTTATKERKRAIKFVQRFGHMKRCNTEELDQQLKIIEKRIYFELSISKDLRNLIQLLDDLTARHFYKTAIKLINQNKK